MSLTLSYEDKRDLLIGMLYKRSNTQVASRSYTYDELARPTSRGTTRDGQSASDSFAYNNRSELTSATVSGESYAYDYDNIGNRETAQEAADAVTAYATNSLNQYTAIGDFTPTFDDAGNQTLVKTSTGIWAVTYDAENRPTLFSNAESSTTVECTYDYMGRRATKKVTVNGSVTLHQRYIYRGYLQIACCDLTRSSHPCLWLLCWDPTQTTATRPLAIQINGTWFTYGWDLTKNICEVYGQHGYIRTAYTYSPYGSVTMSGDLIQPMQWSSEYYDTELALVYYNYRHYNPTDGRWLGRDLVESKYMKNNKYIYIANNVIKMLDVTGRYYLNIDDDSWTMYYIYLNNTTSTGTKESPSELYQLGIINEAIYESVGVIKREPKPVATWPHAFYDVDLLIPGVSQELLNVIEVKHNIIFNVWDQITCLLRRYVRTKLPIQKSPCGEMDLVYRTIRAYHFGSVRFALGRGTVGTVTYINLKWKESTTVKFHGGYEWEGKVNIYYSDIFEDPYDVGYESSIPYAYYHYWEGEDEIKISNYWFY